MKGRGGAERAMIGGEGRGNSLNRRRKFRGEGEEAGGTYDPPT